MRPDAGQKMQQPEAGDAVARILDEPQQRQHVLDVRGVEELQAAELHERDVAPGQFDLQRAAVARRPEQHRLLLQQRAGFAVLEDALDDAAGLVGLVAHRDKLRLGAGGPFGPEVLGEALLGQIDDAVGGGQDGLRRAVVAVERDDAGRRRELGREIEDVAHRGRPERVDRLRVVADHGEAAAAGLQRQQDRRLQPVGVLIFVDQHMVEAAADVVGQRRIAHGLRPVQQQVVVIEHVLLLLGLDIGGEQFLQLGRPAGAPGKRCAEHLLDRGLGVDAAGVDRKARALGRKPALGLGESLLVPDQVHQVGGILAVVDRELGIEADLVGVVAQQPRADAVEGAGPGQARRS